MSWCSNPYDHEREGRDAARWGERHDYEHERRMHEAAWDRGSCDGYYARGYEREIAYQRECREMEEREERHRQESAQHRAREQQWIEEQQYAQQYDDPPPDEPPEADGAALAPTNTPAASGGRDGGE
mgnify:CR=1 FL=1